jgi:hypothetical protein
MGPMSVCRRRWFVLVPPLGSGKENDVTHLVQVNDTHGNFTQTLSPVDIGFGCPGDTATTELRTDSILGRKRVNVNVGLRCSDALAIEPGNLQKEISCVSLFEMLYIPIEWKAGASGSQEGERLMK